MSILLIAFTVLILINTVVMRQRLSALRRLPPVDNLATESTALRFAVAPGVELDDETRRAASQYCEKEGLEALDLVPSGLPALGAIALASAFDPARYRAARLVRGITAFHALGLSPNLCERGELEPESVRDTVALTRMAVKAKICACTTADLAVIPGRARQPDMRQRMMLMREYAGMGTSILLALHFLSLAVLIVGLALPTTRIWGIVAVSAFQLQPLLIVVGTAFRPRDLPLAVLFRLPWELYALIRTVMGRRRPVADEKRIEELRRIYKEMLAGGIDRFFEEKRETCPMCGSKESKELVVSRDRMLHKPGRFTLERCRVCRHVFQNPRLTPEGLDFYYRDCYDGLYEDESIRIFSLRPSLYTDRAKMVASVLQPKRWLDVGAGHCHFCCVAREVLPETSFDGLDISECIDQAERRGWIDRAYRGLFPETAGTLQGVYDVVSMHHYLEHTLEPAKELDAARTVLRDGGLLFIEVPNPESRFARLLGSFWHNWFQPQHLHFVTAKKLEELLRQRGFTPIEWHLGQAHQGNDLILAVFHLLTRLAPPPGLPWRRPATLHARGWRGLVMILGAPLLVLALFTTPLVKLVGRHPSWSNTYRVLARKDGIVSHR